MPIARIADKLLFFAHIPKTGGGSVEDYMASKGKVALRHPFRKGWSRSTAQHMHAEIHRGLVPETFCDQSFTILRDPLDRFLSEYRYRKMRDETALGFDQWARQVLGVSQFDPYCFDNHLRPQAEFLRWNMRVFDFSKGLDPVFDWIDAFTNTPRADRVSRKNVSDAFEIVVSSDVKALIEQRYGQDIALLAALRSATAGSDNNVRAKFLAELSETDRT